MIVAARRPTRRVNATGRCAGFTLLEVGLVIAILGLLAFLIADFHVNQMNLRTAERRVDGVVRDVRTIIDASLAWAATNPDGRWPHDVARNSEIDIALLRDDGLLTALPGNRYRSCPGRNTGQPDADECQSYTLIGWDRGDRARDGAYRTAYSASAADPNNPEDLVVRFTMPGSHAYTVAAQLPQGAAELEDPDDPDAKDVYRVEARVLQGGSTRFVLLNNEGRPLIFSPSPAAAAFGAGNLYNVRNISSSPPASTSGVFLGFDPDDGLQVERGDLKVLENLQVDGFINGCRISTTSCP